MKSHFSLERISAADGLSELLARNTSPNTLGQHSDQVARVSKYGEQLPMARSGRFYDSLWQLQSLLAGGGRRQKA
jgi:hypothetical protein